MGRVSGGRIGSSRGLFSKTSSSSSTFSSFRPRIFGGPSIYFRRFDKTSNNNNEKSLSENIKEKNIVGIFHNIANILIKSNSTHTYIIISIFCNICNILLCYKENI